MKKWEFKKFKLIQNEIVYADEKGELRAWEQPNNTIVLFTGKSGTEDVEDYPEHISFPNAAIPTLISFLERIKIPCPEGRRLFDISWRAPAEEHGALYADYLEHITTCAECELGLKLTDGDIQRCRDDIDGHRRGSHLSVRLEGNTRSV